MENLKEKLLREYDVVCQEIAKGKLSSIPVIKYGKKSTKGTFVGKNGNWGLTTNKERKNGKLGDLAYRNSIEKMIDAGLVSIRAIDEYKGKMRGIIGGNDTDLKNVLRFLISRIGEGSSTISYPEIDVTVDHNEGHLLKCYVNRYERDRSARDECIEEKGCFCQVCGLDFSRMYGDLGNDYIHVHHLIPLHTIKKGYRVNPKKDLIPVCPNCHAMLHRMIEDRKYDTEEQYRAAVKSLKEIIASNMKSL